MRFEAFQRAVAEHRDRVFGLALYSLRHRQDAEDLTQDVLLRLWRHGGRVPSEHIGPWLLRVTRNACVDAVRRRSVRSRFDAPEEAAVQVATSAPDPEVRASAEEFQQRLRRALEGLREPYRSVVYLREVQGLKYDEIATTLEIPMARVKVQLHRGRRLLREALEADPSADVVSEPTLHGTKRGTRSAIPSSTATGTAAPTARTRTDGSSAVGSSSLHPGPSRSTEAIRRATARTEPPLHEVAHAS